MLKFWCCVLIVVTSTGSYTNIKADTLSGVLPLNISPDNDVQISPRRQRLIELLTEFIEKNVPPGVWTRDGGQALSRNKGRALWNNFKSDDDIEIDAQFRSDENERNKFQQTVDFRDGNLKSRVKTKSDQNSRGRATNLSADSPRSTVSNQNSQRRDNRRKVFVKRKRLEVSSKSKPISTYIPAQPAEDCDDDSIITDSDSFIANEKPQKATNTQNGYDYGTPYVDTASYKDEEYDGEDDFRPGYDQVTPSPTYPACTASARATALMQTWKREMREKQRRFSSNDEGFTDDADYDNEDYQSRRRPEPPLWSASMTLRGQLTVPMAGYTENYTLWYDADSGDSRLELNGGMTTALRLRTSNGLYKLLGMQHTAQSDGSTRRICRVANRVALSFADTAAAVLPDMSQFTFQGFLESYQTETGSARGYRRVERWQLVNSQSVTATETACEEQLTYRHEVLIERRQDGSVPLKYSVEIDSSILGKGSDRYVHTYQEMELATPSSDIFYFNEKIECQQYEKVNIGDPEHYTTYFDPLREFRSLTRDSLYTEGISLARYKKRFSRKYKDRTEEVLRKNILMQKIRFVSAVNRRGETFILEVNFLSDKLKDDLKQGFFGAIPYQHGGPVAPTGPFPYTRSFLRRRAKSLPDHFDWREHGWVSTVYRQHPCNTCWAYAVVGAVEGGLFARTKRNLDLSEQSLIDCGHLTGANNCNATWPFYAYEYARQYGIPEVEEYGPHISKVGDCKVEEASPAAHISGHVNVTAKNVLALQTAIYNNGPVVVLIDASTDYFQSLHTGILHDPECKEELEDINHAVLAVGWGQNSKGVIYFILKNSWGTDWADNGYVNLHGENNCAILTGPSYPLFPRDTA